MTKPNFSTTKTQADILVCFENYISKKYLELSGYIRFGRLPVHEMLKVECALFGEKYGYDVVVEYRVDYSKRIDVVWFKNGKIITAIEIDEGINKRAIWKLNKSGAENKVCIFFDVKKMAQRQINNFYFNNFKVINLVLGDLNSGEHYPKKIRLLKKADGLHSIARTGHF